MQILKEYFNQKDQQIDQEKPNNQIVNFVKEIQQLKQELIIYKESSKKIHDELESYKFEQDFRKQSLGQKANQKLQDSQQ